MAKQKTAFGLPTVFAVKKSKAVSGSRVFDTRWPSAVTVGFEPEGKQTHDSAFVPETAKTPRTLNYYSGGRDPAGAAVETKKPARKHWLFISFDGGDGGVWLQDIGIPCRKT